MFDVFLFLFKHVHVNIIIEKHHASLQTKAFLCPLFAIINVHSPTTLQTIYILLYSSYIYYMFSFNSWLKVWNMHAKANHRFSCDRGLHQTTMASPRHEDVDIGSRFAKTLQELLHRLLAQLLDILFSHTNLPAKEVLVWLNLTS